MEVPEPGTTWPIIALWPLVREGRGASMWQALCTKVRARADPNFVSFPSIKRGMEFSFINFHLISCLKTSLKVLGKNEDANMVNIVQERIENDCRRKYSSRKLKRQNKHEKAGVILNIMIIHKQMKKDRYANGPRVKWLEMGGIQQGGKLIWSDNPAERQI